MAKKKVAKKSSFLKSKNDKKLFAVGVVAFFVFAFFLAFVSVGEPTSVQVTGEAIVNDGSIEDFVTDWQGGNLDANIVKYVLWFMATLLLASLMSSMGIRKGINWLVAIPLSFITIAFITPEEIFTLLTAYTAVGLTFTFVVPLLIMIYASVGIMQGRPSPFKLVTVKTIWAAFTAFLIYRMIMLLVVYKSSEYSIGILIVMVAILVVAAFITVFNKKFRRKLLRFANEAERHAKVRAAQRAGQQAGVEKVETQAEKDIVQA